MAIIISGCLNVFLNGGNIVDTENLSNSMIVLILLYALLGGSCFAARFWQRHPAHLLWTVPTGFVLAFVFAAICVAIGELVWGIVGCGSAVAMLYFIAKPIPHKKQTVAAPQSVSPDHDWQALQQQQAKLEQEVARLNQIILANAAVVSDKLRLDKLPECGATVQFAYAKDKDEMRVYTVKVSSVDDGYLHGRDVDRDLKRTFQRNRIQNGEVRDVATGDVFFL